MVGYFKDGWLLQGWLFTAIPIEGLFLAALGGNPLVRIFGSLMFGKLPCRLPSEAQLGQHSGAASPTASSRPAIEKAEARRETSFSLG